LIVRRATEADLPIWAAMLTRLHTDLTADEFESELRWFALLEQPYVGFLAFTLDGKPIGVIDARVRNYAEGAPNLRAAYVEDLWVEPAYRRTGVATALLAEVEQWARSHRFDWLGSDTTPDNQLSRHWHRQMGFEEVEQLVVFGKSLNG
jgi:aminoglycoside 6'-N-acetyltransferase I